MNISLFSGKSTTGSCRLFLSIVPETTVFLLRKSSFRSVSLAFLSVLRCLQLFEFYSQDSKSSSHPESTTVIWYQPEKSLVVLISKFDGMIRTRNHLQRKCLERCWDVRSVCADDLQISKINVNMKFILEIKMNHRSSTRIDYLQRFSSPEEIFGDKRLEFF